MLFGQFICVYISVCVLRRSQGCFIYGNASSAKVVLITLQQTHSVSITTLETRRTNTRKPREHSTENEPLIRFHRP
ncbi:unnamed protein product [Brassica rapa subsp. narinosa]